MGDSTQTVPGESDLRQAYNEVTLRLAEGYTLGSTPAAKKKFSDAASAIDRYIARTKQLATSGNMPPETEKLLVDQATTLKQKVLEQAM